jgi:hypothetical protein
LAWIFCNTSPMLMLLCVSPTSVPGTAKIDGTQQNSALVEELSASPLSRAQRAELVTQSVRVFRLNTGRRAA